MKKWDILSMFFVLFIFIVSIGLFFTTEEARPNILVEKYREMESKEKSIISLKENKLKKEIELEAIQKQENEIIQKRNMIEVKNFDIKLDIPSILVFLEQTANKNNLTITINTPNTNNANLNNNDNINLNNKNNNKNNTNNATNNSNVNSNQLNSLNNANNDNSNKNSNNSSNKTQNNYSNTTNNSNNTSSSNNTQNSNSQEPKISIEQENKRGLNEITFNLNIKGKYRNIRNYISTIEKTNYVKVTKFTIRSGEEAEVEVKFLYFNE